MRMRKGVLHVMDIFRPVQLAADTVTYRLLQIPPHSYLGDSVNFFIYDTIKIGLMLVFINFVMAAVRFYFPMEKARDILTKRKWFGLDYLLAALLGVVTPFCSCSSIPLFIGFIGAGIPLGVTFAFLISSPLVNESSLYLFPAMFGMKITLLYNAAGIAISMLGGLIIQKSGLEKYVKTDLLASKTKRRILHGYGGKALPVKELLKYFWNDGMNITRNVFPYVVAGVGIGALIHGFIPSTLVEGYLSTRSWWAVPLAAVLGAPLYANSVGVVPVMEALVKKGVPLGTALAFMTSIVTVSIPEIMILRKVMKWQLLAAFITITLSGAITVGYLFNAL